MSPVPEPLAAIEIAGAAGARFIVRRHGNPRGPRLILSHGNGFAIDGYAVFWSLLLRDFEVVVFDMRNHGQNPPAEPPAHDYAHMADDVEAVRAAAAAEFGIRPTAGVFHSMSAQAAMIAVLRHGWRFDALVLFDPPNVPPPGSAAREPMLAYLRTLAAWSATRPERFDDPAELARDYATTRAGAAWVEGAHRAAAEAVLRRLPDGGYALRCPPAFEASIYEQGMTLDLWPPRGAFAGPVKLVAADPTRPFPTATALANRALAEDGKYNYLPLPGAGHLLQLEQPAACADAVTAFLATAGIR